MTLASWGVFLCLGDGESGAKCFSAARDGKQARISHEHAMQMIRMSPALSAICRVNESTGEIKDVETNSRYKILSADNIKGQEGLNGNILVDECHVVDRRFADVVRYAGASREEPLHIEVSTAGDDPDGYGFAQYQFGKKVESGELDVQDFFFRAWEAPQDTTREQLKDRDELIRLGKLANPSWGRIVRESEFIASYESAKDTGSKLDRFLMYRCGVWMRSSVKTWLNFAAWNKCERDFTDEQLRGQTAFAGLDMASKKDLNALSAMLPRGRRSLQVFVVVLAAGRDRESARACRTVHTLAAGSKKQFDADRRLDGPSRGRRAEIRRTRR